MTFKHNKRPFSDEELCQHSHKHPRQLDYGNRWPFTEIGLDVPEELNTSGEESFDTLVSHTTTVLSVSDDEFDSCAYGNFSSLSWFTTNDTFVEGAKLEPALEISHFPNFPEHSHPPRVEIQPEEMDSSHLDHSSRRPVSIGPDHQAEVPDWSVQDAKDASGFFNWPPPASNTESDTDVAFPPASIVRSSVSSPKLMGDDVNGMKLLVGICTMSIPLADDRESIGNGRTDCNCLDKGSVRCVRQHVTEAREKLRGMLGQQKFVELGFYDMGEDVAQKWSEEEEHVFRKVVFSNPSSSGKDFWDQLSLVCPTRSKKDLVSYYFNVFMLRRRAEQNRLDTLSIDSDDDEWHESNEVECSMTEDGEVSVLGSPVNQYIVHDVAGLDYHEDDDVGYDDYGSNEDGDVAGEDDGKGLDNDSETLINDKSTPENWLYGDSCIPIMGFASNNLRDGSEDQDLEDDSCTSSECQLNGTNSGPIRRPVMQKNQGKTDYKRLHYDFMNENLVDLVDHGYILEPRDVKVWDVGFTSPKKHDDSPMWNRIEEALGDESWSNNMIWDNPGIH